MMRQTYKLLNQDKNRQFTIYVGSLEKLEEETYIKGQLAGLFRKILQQQHRGKGGDIHNIEIHFKLYLGGCVTHNQVRNMGYIIYIHMYVLLNNCFFIKLKPHGKDFSDSNRINLHTFF